MHGTLEKSARSPLLAILASPPLGTSGLRTLTRVHAAASLIGSDGIIVTNIFAAPTTDVLAISEAGGTPAHWLVARSQIESAFASPVDILLAWGLQEPTGAARGFHRAQVAWVREMAVHAHANIWMVGGQPRHPSRWQRFTSREFPHLNFDDALALALRCERTE